MSRSFVGSSSSSTFGSSISSRISCSRRRSPPERSRTSVRARSPRKPKRSHSIPAVISCAAAERRDARAPPRATRARAGGRGSRPCPARGARAAPSRRARPRRSRARASPPSSADQRRLAGAVDADERDAVARPEPPGDVAQHPPPVVGDRDVDRVEHPVAQPRGREAQQLGAVARLRLVGDQRVRGLDPELRLRRARRRAAAQPGELLAQQLPRGGPRAPPPAARARRARARRPRSRRRTGGRAPSATSHVAVQTASRNQRSWVTTSSEPRRAARWRASQSTPSTSRWFVGSSSSSSSGPSSSSARERDPPPLAARQRRDRRVEPVREAARPDAAEQAVEHGPERGVARPLVVGAAADELLADRARRVELVALAEQRHAPSRRTPRDRARVRLLGAGDQPQQRRLAVAVAPDDADPVARRRRRA